MAIEFIGNPINIYRFETGLYSFDRACMNARGDIGFPIGTITTLAGPTSCGKSTTVYSICAIMAQHLESNIALADFEGYDAQYLSDVLSANGFDGKVNLIQKETDEMALNTLEELIKDDDYALGIVDAIGAISPFAETESELQEADMGRRAKLLGKFSRRLIHYLRLNKKNVFAINHIHPNIGGWGMVEPGGEAIKYLSGVKIRMNRKEEFDDGSFVTLGKVKKNKFGAGDRTFVLFILAGKGVHKGLTAVYDCLITERAVKKRTIKIGDKSFGFMKDLINAAHDGDDEKFEPFYKALADENL